MMHLEQVSIKLIKQVYPTTIRRGITRFHSLYKPIRTNTTTRIVEMLPHHQKRILKHKNKMIENRIYLPRTNGNYSRNQNRLCPMRYTKVLCHACYQEIESHCLYLSKNGEHGRSKYYHVTCAEDKNILVI